MNIQQLEYILAVDQHRHFARAAEQCRVTQPTLSMMIQKLEEELNVKIFDRHEQPVKPTATGKKIIEQARIALHQTAMIKEIVSEEEGTLIGSFRLAILPTIAPYLLPGLLKELNSEKVELDIRFMEIQTAQTLKALTRGDIDAAIIAAYPLESELQGTTLFFEEYLGYVSQNEPLFKNELIRTSDISGERLWLLDEGHCFRDQLMRFCQLEKVKLNQMAYKFGSMDTFMKMVESGNGITFIPQLAVLQLGENRKKLVRPFAIPKPTREIVFVTRKDFIRHKVGKILIEAIRRSVPKEMLTLQVGQKTV